MRRATKHCVDCGSLKQSGLHYMAQRCADCSREFYEAMLRANAAVTKAKARGELLPASLFKCGDCGEQARDWDHRDYSKPLEVSAVCRLCNFKRGPAKYRVPAEPAQEGA